jgi:hypothetical protein
MKTVTVKSTARWLLLAAVLAATLVLAAMSGWPSPAPPDTAVADGGPGAGLHRTAIPAAPAAPAERLATRRQAAPPVIAAAGDVACDPAGPSFHGGKGVADACHMDATAKLLLDLDPVVVLTLGDNQYENGTLAKFRRSYHLSWGRLKARTRPAPGNHDYETAGAAGYFDYFGAAAGHRSTGYYSFDVGAWHLIALNSECAHVGGCGKGSRQERWLRADLATHPTRCTLAYWHKPRFSSGMHGNDATYDALWQALYAAGADVVLVGHDHDYERFAPRRPTPGPTRPGACASSSSAPAARPTTDSTRSGPTARFATPAPSACYGSPCTPPATTGASCPSRARPSPTKAMAAATDPAPRGAAPWRVRRQAVLATSRQPDQASR